MRPCYGPDRNKRPGRRDYPCVPPITRAAAAALAATPPQTIGANHQGGRFFFWSMTKTPDDAVAGERAECQTCGGPRGLPSRTGCGRRGSAAAKAIAGARISRDCDTGSIARAAIAASRVPAAGPSSLRGASAVTRGAGRIGLSTTEVVAGLNAEPSAVVRGRPLLSSEEASATSRASHSAASRTGRAARVPRGIAGAFTAPI